MNPPPNVDDVRVFISKSKSEKSESEEEDFYPWIECESKEQFDDYFHGRVIRKLIHKTFYINGDIVEINYVVSSMKNVHWIENRVPVNIMCEDEIENIVSSINDDATQDIFLSGCCAPQTDPQIFEGSNMPPSDPQP